ncbi:FAD-dependent oxidoreductase [Candidatus Nomurabacteria bacterium]|nr:FAD-dependent oxidoreductase [Candidatus Nomurabacteria bacterium]
MIYQLAIIGGGPAAAGAAVYAGRKQLSTIMIAEDIGGQSAVSETIFNWIGTPAIGGGALASSLRAHVAEYAQDKSGSVTLHTGTRVEKVTEGATPEAPFSLSLSSGETVEAQTVLVATGSRYRKLDVPGAERFDNKGVMYCATCDGPLFSGFPVVVIGGGNAAFEAALQLSQYATAVTLIHRSDSFKADPITIEKVKADPKITIITNAEAVSIDGSTLVERFTYKIKGEENMRDVAVSGVFVEIGQIPNTALVEGLAALDESKKIVADPYTQRTSIEGLWAAGDCANGKYHQNNIAVGDAVKAIEDIYLWLKTGK